MDPTIPSVLQALPSRAFNDLLDRAAYRRLEEGEYLYVCGDRERRCHLIASGTIKLVARDAEGEETILALAVPGDIVGDVAGLDELGQPLDAVALSDSDVYGFDVDHLLRALTSHPEAALELARSLAAKTRWMYETTLERSAGEVPARLAGRLLALADILGYVDGGTLQMDLPMHQGELGRLAGMCRESACKALRNFKKHGVVDYEGRKLRILRPDVLEKIRCAGRASTPSR
jgi:CRP/FNR family transcriptional regulator, cyclic AMP receptor protein